MRFRKFFVFFALIVLVQAACNMPLNPAPDTGDGSATFAAMTLLAGTPTPMPHNSPPPQASATPSATSAPPEVTTTPTYSVPMVGVSERTNCRSGPGVNYQLVVVISPGEQVEILGAFPPQYWLVRTDYGDCWLYAEFATPVGSFWAVASVTPPPTSTGIPPQAPIIQKWDFFCNSVTGQTDVTIQWKDTASNEDGYRVIRDNAAVADLPPNSTEYSETIDLVSGESADYAIEVYTADFKASSSTFTITCP